MSARLAQKYTEMHKHMYTYPEHTGQYIPACTYRLLRIATVDMSYNFAKLMEKLPTISSTTTVSIAIRLEFARYAETIKYAQVVFAFD